MLQNCLDAGIVVRKSAAMTSFTYVIPGILASDHVISAGESGKPANTPGTAIGAASSAAATSETVPQTVAESNGSSDPAGRTLMARTWGTVWSWYGAMPPPASGFQTRPSRISDRWTWSYACMTVPSTVLPATTCCPSRTFTTRWKYWKTPRAFVLTEIAVSSM